MTGSAADDDELFASWSTFARYPAMLGGTVAGQLVGIALAWIISIVGTLILLKLVDLTVGLRVTREQEVEGLDLTQHGEEGYDFAS